MDRRYANTATQTKTNSVTFNRTERAGILYDIGTNSIPARTLLCDGTSKLVADYPDLFAVIGYTFGGAGANFNVPDIRGRAKIGTGTGSGLTARTLAQQVGAETHVLTAAQIPGHSHSGSTGGISANHTHGYTFTNFAVNAGREGGGQATVGYIQHLGANTGTVSSDHGHGFTTNNGNGVGGGSHPNVQPSIVVTAVISY